MMSWFDWSAVAYLVRLVIFVFGVLVVGGTAYHLIKNGFKLTLGRAIAAFEETIREFWDEIEGL